METRRLYYEDSQIREFDARVVDCQAVEGGYAVTLDATAFYPEGGGQPCDLGTLENVRVLDVQEKNGQVVHLCDGPLTVGGNVHGKIDWARRFDLMQQHTGEHIVSGIISRRYGWHNVGFHMGSDVITIDFDGPIPAADLPEIEAEANRAVWLAGDVLSWVPSEEQLPKEIYRSKRALSWPVRLVEIPGWDRCACCGVHVANTGEIGLIKLFSCVKFHQGVRIEMACGGRALGILNAVYEQNRLVSQAFSAKIMETGEAAKKMNQRLAEAEFRCTALERQIYDGVAAGYTGKGNVLHVDSSLTPAAIRELADRIAKRCGGIAAVVGGGETPGVCLMGEAEAVAQWGAALKSRFNARGGGKPGIFQGTVSATAEQLEMFFGDWYVCNKTQP